MFKSRSRGEEPDWDADFEPLMKVLLGKKGIKTKAASEVGRKKVDYFRGRDFKKFILSNEELLKKKCSGALKAALDGKPPTTEKDAERLGAELIEKNFCCKAIYKPLNPSSKDSDKDKKKEKKWPDRLVRVNTPNQPFDLEGYYVIVYEGGGGLQHFLLALIIVGVLLACMFPVWPIWAKIGVWYLSVVLLTLYFGILILRMVVFTLFWIVGFDFWILPNINDEYCGFLDSFQPLYSWEKRADDFMMLIVRFGSLVIVAAAVHQIAQTTSLSDVSELITSSYTDVLDWGVDKLTALPGSDKAALPSLEQLQKESAEENSTTGSPSSTEPPAQTVDDITADEDDAIEVEPSTTEEKPAE